MKKLILFFVLLASLTSCGKLQDKLYYCNVNLSVIETDTKSTLSDGVSSFKEGDRIRYIFYVETHPNDDLIIIKGTCGFLKYENGSWNTYVAVGEYGSLPVERVDTIELTSSSLVADIWARFEYNDKQYLTPHIGFVEGPLDMTINPLDIVDKVEEATTE